MPTILLASSSPRRKDLIRQIHWEAVIQKSRFAEVPTPEEAARRRFSPEASRLLAAFTGPDLVCVVNALGKGADVKKRSESSLPVVGADTIVTLDGRILGKPENREEAAEMLRFLSGRRHMVKTGVALLYGEQVLVRVETTEVSFRSLQEKEIQAYVSSGEPMDKAGAYGIQGLGTLLVQSIHGSYDNVVGLPLVLLYEMMKEAGAIS